jgi:mono/diheme cytochrome c family protein
MGKTRLLWASLAILAHASGCKAETSLDDYPCPDARTKLTYDSFGRDFMAQNCQICHGQTAGERQGAPDGYDFGTLDAVRARKSRIFARAAADNMTMPPGRDDPPAAERGKLAEWLACGAP